MLLLLIHAAATWFLVGLIWVIQLVHYPLMIHVTQGFGAFHEAHSMRITWIVGPLMCTELVTAFLLTQGGLGIPAWAAWLGLGLVGVCWLATLLLAIPQHAVLAKGMDPIALARLVGTNWLRTLAWSARGVLVLWMLHAATAATS